MVAMFLPLFATFVPARAEFLTRLQDTLPARLIFSSV
jgi:hypothetical protein